jgi:hypothetical protein
METFGRLLMLLGLLLLVLGGGIVLLARLGWPFGRLPGDIHVEGKNFSFYFPLASSLLLSLLLTALLNLIARLWTK